MAWPVAKSPRLLQHTIRVALYTLLRFPSPASMGVFVGRASELAQALADALSKLSPEPERHKGLAGPTSSPYYEVQAATELAELLPSMEGPWARQAAVWAPPLWRLLVAQAPAKAVRIPSHQAHLPSVRHRYSKLNFELDPKPCNV